MASVVSTPVHWKDLVRGCRAIRHAGSEKSWNSFGFGISASEKDEEKWRSLISRWEKSFEGATRDDDTDEEVFMNVGSVLNQLRRERGYSCSVLIKDCFPSSINDQFDNLKWSNGEMTLGEFLKQSRESWENRNLEYTKQMIEIMARLCQGIEKVIEIAARK